MLHHRHRPGLRQRPLPDDADGPVRRGAPGAGPRDPRLHQLQGDYEVEMGIGMPPEYTPLLEHTEILAMSWGGDGADDGPRRRRRARGDHHDLGEVGHRRRHHHGQGRHRTPARWRPSASPSTGSSRASPGSAWSTSTGSAGRRPGLAPGHRERRLPGGDRRDARRSPRRRPSASPTAAGRDAAAAGCLATGLRALNAVPARQRAAARVGHRPGPAAHPRGRHHPLSPPAPDHRVPPPADPRPQETP